MRKLTRLELDVTFSGGCCDPECKDPHPNEGLFMSPACHPGNPVNVRYDIHDGTMTLECDVCGDIVTVIQVAKTPE